MARHARTNSRPRRAGAPARRLHTCCSKTRISRGATACLRQSGAPPQRSVGNVAVGAAGARPRPRRARGERRLAALGARFCPAAPSGEFSPPGDACCFAAQLARARGPRAGESAAGRFGAGATTTLRAMPALGDAGVGGGVALRGCAGCGDASAAAEARLVGACPEPRPPAAVVVGAAGAADVGRAALLAGGWVLAQPATSREISRTRALRWPVTALRCMFRFLASAVLSVIAANTCLAQSSASTRPSRSAASAAPARSRQRRASASVAAASALAQVLRAADSPRRPSSSTRTRAICRCSARSDSSAAAARASAASQELRQKTASAVASNKLLVYSPAGREPKSRCTSGPAGLSLQRRASADRCPCRESWRNRSAELVCCGSGESERRRGGTHCAARCWRRARRCGAPLPRAPAPAAGRAAAPPRGATAQAGPSGQTWPPARSPGPWPAPRLRRQGQHRPLPHAAPPLPPRGAQPPVHAQAWGTSRLHGGVLARGWDPRGAPGPTASVWPTRRNGGRGRQRRRCGCCGRSHGLPGSGSGAARSPHSDPLRRRPGPESEHGARSAIALVGGQVLTVRSPGLRPTRCSIRWPLRPRRLRNCPCRQARAQAVRRVLL